MKFYYYSPSETFVVLTAISLLDAMMARLNNRSRIATFFEEIAHFLDLILRKNKSPRHKDDVV